jgi:ABC-type transport system substrate-binding protein
VIIPSSSRSTAAKLRTAAAGAVPAAFALSALFMVAACSRGGTAAATRYLQVDIETSPTSLDPRFATDAISSRIDELAFDSLVRVDADGGFRSGLAQSIERPSPTVLVFHLRRGVRFADGRKLTARDVKFTYDSTLDARSLSPKRAALEPLESIAAAGDYTVTMTTRAPYAPALTMATLGIVPAGTPAVAAGSGALTPGSGPFELAAFARDDRVVLRRNPYRPPVHGAVGGIVFKVVPDPTVRALELTKGVCALAENNIQPELLGYLGRQSRLAIVKSPGSAYQYLAFNFRDRRLKDLRVRRAIAYAIDRRRIVDSFLRGTARVASGMLSPENWAYDGDVMTYPYEPERARRLLDQAGFAAGPDGMRRGLSFVYKTTPEGARLGELIQAMLRRVGITLTVRTNEWATFYGDIQRGNFDMTSMQWVGINDPHQYYMVFDSKMTPPRGFNRGYYANPEMDRLVEAGDAALDRQARRRIYGAVQRLAAADLPYLSLWWKDNVVVMNRALDGFRSYPNGSLASLATLTLVSPPAAEPLE